MLVGLEVHRDDAYDEVLQLAEALGTQVVQGLSPFTDFPTDHPLYVGQSDRAFTPFRSLEGADVLINMGSPMLYQEGAAPVVSPYWKIIEARSVGNDVARWTADTVPIVANVKETAAALLEAVRSGMSAERESQGQEPHRRHGRVQPQGLADPRSHGGGAQRPDADRLGTRRAGSAAPA